MLNEPLLDLKGDLVKNGFRMKEAASKSGYPYDTFQKIINGFYQVPNGFESKVRQALGICPVAQPSYSSEQLHAVAEKIGITAAFMLTDTNIENLIISKMIPQLPKEKIARADGEIRRAWLDAAIEIFNNQHKESKWVKSES
jgi:hypothetical protein